ncbi:AtuA-related protein [Bordetella sp. 2513F-2]
MSRLLQDIAYVRAGDKGDNVSIGLLAKKQEDYPALLRSATPDAIRKLYGDWVKGEVNVYPMPNIDGCLVLLEQALGGGATCTLRFDQTAKSLGYALLRLPVRD